MNWIFDADDSLTESRSQSVRLADKPFQGLGIFTWCHAIARVLYKCTRVPTTSAARRHRCAICVPHTHLPTARGAARRGARQGARQGQAGGRAANIRDESRGTAWVMLPNGA